MESSERIIKQSGVAPYLVENGERRYVLITSMAGDWIFPKGMLEPDMTARESAALEGLEEAGVEGEPGHEVVAQYTYVKRQGISCTVDFYLMPVFRVWDEWLESSGRKRRICGYEEALGLIREEMRGVLTDAEAHLASGGRGF
ncbi:MAG: NUDIX hydrolase [Desulfococcaceae bacterium]